MILVDNRNNTNPYLNLAIEEYLIRYADCSLQDYLLLYINQPCVIVGKNQSIYKEVNFDFLRSKRLLLARRISGGGTVYHDEGNLSFAFISSFAANKINNYRFFNQPVIDALNSIGISAVADERNNIMSNGKKISGSAQFTDRKNIISHGTLLFNADLHILRSCLQKNEFNVESRAVDSVRSSVANISEMTQKLSSVEDLKQFLISRLPIQEKFQFPDKQWEIVERMANDKFMSFDWIYGRSPKTVISKNCITIEVENGIVTSVIASDHTHFPDEEFPNIVGINYNADELEKYFIRCKASMRWMDIFF